MELKVSKAEHDNFQNAKKGKNLYGFEGFVHDLERSFELAY